MSSDVRAPESDWAGAPQHAHVVTVSASPTGAAELIIDAAGGAYDSAGDIVRALIVVSVDSPSECYRIAKELCDVANRRRESSGMTHNPGPFIVVPAKKRSPPLKVFVLPRLKSNSRSVREILVLLHESGLLWTGPHMRTSEDIAAGVPFDIKEAVDTALSDGNIALNGGAMRTVDAWPKSDPDSMLLDVDGQSFLVKFE